MGRGCSLFWKNSRLNGIHLFACFLLNHFISQCSFSLIHPSHCLAWKLGCRLKAVKRLNSFNLIRSWANVHIGAMLFHLWKPLFLGLAPWWSSSSWIWIHVVLPRAYFVLLLSFEHLNWWLVKLKLITLILIIAISMNIWRNRRNGLVFIYIDQVLNYFWFSSHILTVNFLTLQIIIFVYIA
jgi:hypothetical protein